MTNGGVSRYLRMAMGVVRGRGASPPDLSERPVRTEGFTLLEIMLALGVLAVALVALLGLRNRDLSMQAQARHLVTATALAKLKLEELIVVPDARDGEPAGEFGERYPGFRWTRSIAPAPLIDWLEYRVEVSWPEGSRQERVELMTYVKTPTEL